MKKTYLEDVLILNAIRVFRAAVRILPYRVSIGIGTFIGDLGYLFSKRRGVMKKNLRAVFAGQKTAGEMARIARESFRNLGRSGIELLRVPEIDRPFIEKYVRVIGKEKVDAALAKGKGVIFLTGHFGSWEMLNVAASILGYPMVALARVQKHPMSDAYLNDLRRSKGSQVIYKGMPVREILKALREGRIVGIIGDQDGGRGGTFVDFFGRLSSYPKGVAAFSLRTGAPILPAFIFREKGIGHRIEVGDPLTFPPDSAADDEKEKMILQQFAERMETNIAKDPGQWLWAHRRWKSTPDRFVVVLSDGKAGHRNQSMALYDAIARQRAASGFAPERTHVKVIEVVFRDEFSKKAFSALNHLFRGRVPLAGFWAKRFLSGDCYREIMASYADFVISAGSSVAGVNLWCASENEARPVVVMDPGFGLSPFHAVIAPRHDKLPKRSNVFETSGALTRTSLERLEEEGLHIQKQYGLPTAQKKIGLLIGGDTAEMHLEEKAFLGQMDQVSRAATERRCLVLATTSRRTPGWADRAMKRFFANQVFCPLLVIANESNPPGTVGGILGLSDVIVVTGESISMVSESVSSGKRVLVIEPFGGAHLTAKHQQFLSRLEAEGSITRVPEDGLYAALEMELGQEPRRAGSAPPDYDVLRVAAEMITR